MLKNNYAFIIGILGGIIILIGLHQTPYYLCGSLALLITAFYYRLTFYIALQIIFLCGNMATILPNAAIILKIMPIFLCLQLFVYYFMIKELNDFFLWIGLAGIVFIVIGFSLNDDYSLLLGSISIASYSWVLVTRGCRAASLWAVLNTFLIIITIIRLSGWGGG